MYLGDPNITKRGLLALKDSKPVPITAHSHEIVVPCIYTETVKKLMKAKGIVLPLTPAKLAEARKVAKAMPGTYEVEGDEKPGGTTHARGTTNVTVNIKNVVHGVSRVRHARRGRKGGRSVVTRASGLIPPPSMKPGPAVHPNYNLIRPFVANTPIGYEPRPAPTKEQIMKELQHEEALEKRLLALEGISKRAKELKEKEEQHVREQIVRPDDFVDYDREKAVAHKMRPSEVEIEQMDEPLPSVKQPERGAPKEPFVPFVDMEREPLLEKIKHHSRSQFRAYDKPVLMKLYQTITGQKLISSMLKDRMVEEVVKAVAEAH